MSVPPPSAPLPREGRMAVVRNRRALITRVQPFSADELPRVHLVQVEYTDGVGAETDQVLREVEPGTEVLEPAALPRIEDTPPMEAPQLGAMVRAALVQVHRAVEMPRVALMLADAVGPGKTLQGGMILQELDRDRHVARAKLVRPRFVQAIDEHWSRRALQANARVGKFPGER